MVELKNVSLSYSLSRKGETAALHRVNAEFEEGSFSAIVGPSGCGKTSLIKIMAALINPGEGMVTVGGSPLTAVRRKTAVIFQDFGLLPWKTVRANAELPLRIGLLNSPPFISHKGTKAQREYNDLDNLLVQFGLAGFSGAYPHQLSGGMKQRLAIVRALAADPDLLLMDEPFSSLDALTREEAQDFFLSVRKERRLTIIMVTHSIEEAVYLADYVYVMNGVNPGSITDRLIISHNGPRSGFRDEAGFREYCAALRRVLQPGRMQRSVSTLQSEQVIREGMPS